MYKFPIITHLDQVRQAIARHRTEGQNEFIVADRGDYLVANYMVSFEDTFRPLEGCSEEENIDRRILLECRGITFGRDGRIIRRPFQKFFNYGEKDLFIPQGITLLKEDGSMIAPMLVNGQVRFGTKMGITEFSTYVEDFVKEHPQIEVMSRELIESGFTPIFEFCSRVNRVVIDHPVTRLPLLAVRNMETGEYHSYEAMCALGSRYDVEVVQQYGDMPFEELHQHIKGLEGIEGVIIRDGYGHMRKLKTDHYLTIHRTKDQINLEKNILRMVVTETVDDLMPLLIPEDAERVVKYRDAVYQNVLSYRDEIVSKTRQTMNVHRDRGSFARAIAKVDPQMKAQMFNAYKAIDWGIDVDEYLWKCLMELLERATFSQPRVDEVRNIIGAKWNTMME